ncbi:hypothetical protein PCE1_003156 [Barthelona sp. PCE]
MSGLDTALRTIISEILLANDASGIESGAMSILIDFVHKYIKKLCDKIVVCRQSDTWENLKVDQRMMILFEKELMNIPRLLQHATMYSMNKLPTTLDSEFFTSASLSFAPNFDISTIFKTDEPIDDESARDTTTEAEEEEEEEEEEPLGMEPVITPIEIALELPKIDIDDESSLLTDISAQQSLSGPESLSKPMPQLPLSNTPHLLSKNLVDETMTFETPDINAADIEDSLLKLNDGEANEKNEKNGMIEIEDIPTLESSVTTKMEAVVEDEIKEEVKEVRFEEKYLFMYIPPKKNPELSTEAVFNSSKNQIVTVFDSLIKENSTK